VVGESAALARATGAELVLLHVAMTEPELTSGGVAPPSAHRTPPVDFARREADLAALAERLRGEDLTVRHEVALTDTAIHDAVLARAEAEDVSYVVLGTHGHARVYELLVGSTTNGVLRGAKVPVVVVPGTRAER
jgi:nucleotide-binding universal stress UspA family protein